MEMLEGGENIFCNIFASACVGVCKSWSDAAKQSHNHKALKPRAHLVIRKYYSYYITTCCSHLVTFCREKENKRLNCDFTACFFYICVHTQQMCAHGAKMFSKYLVTMEDVYRPVFVFDGIVASIVRFLCGFIVAGVNLGESLRWRHHRALINYAGHGMHCICKTSPAVYC